MKTMTRVLQLNVCIWVNQVKYFKVKTRMSIENKKMLFVYQLILSFLLRLLCFVFSKLRFKQVSPEFGVTVL